MVADASLVVCVRIVMVVLSMGSHLVRVSRSCHGGRVIATRQCGGRAVHARQVTRKFDIVTVDSVCLVSVLAAFCDEGYGEGEGGGAV